MFYNSMASVVVLGAMGIRFAHGAPTTGAVRRAYTDFLGFPTYDDMSSSIAAPDLGWTSWLDQSSQTGTSAPSVQDVAILETQNLDPQSLEIQSPASAPSTDTNALFGGGIIAAESDARACACERIPDGFRNQGCVYSNGD
ncbi:hypothetical protein MMC29_003950, partial [Sticta canariensis]|nr:hypothetical protein [Sticta canariensis]